MEVRLPELFFHGQPGLTWNSSLAKSANADLDIETAFYITRGDLMEVIEAFFLVVPQFTDRSSGTWLHSFPARAFREIKAIFVEI